MFVAHFETTSQTLWSPSRDGEGTTKHLAGSYYFVEGYKQRAKCTVVWRSREGFFLPCEVAPLESVTENKDMKMGLIWDL